MTDDANRTKKDSAHDVLAAEEFGVPAPDPSLHHGPVTLPADPTGIAEPHDVLAAEEFALPAASGRYGGGESYGVTRGAPRSRSRAMLVAAGALAVLVLRWRRRRT